MKSWTTTWMTEGLQDEEYKQYLLMAWLQQLGKELDDVKLYPALDTLSQQQRSLHTLMKQFQEIKRSDGRKLTGLDFKTKRLIYEFTHQPSALAEYLERLTAFALPHVEKRLQEGKEVEEFVSSHLNLEPVGVLPLYKNEGYLVLENPHSSAISTYRFTLSMVELVDNHIDRLQFHLLQRRQKSKFTTFTQFKQELIRTFRDLPNPATFVLSSKLPFPELETLLPLGKRLLLKEVV